MRSGSIEDRNGNRAVEHATDAFTPMDAGVFLVFDLLLAGDANRVFLGFDGQVLFGDAGQFENHNEIISLLEDVDRRIAATGGGAGTHPVTGEPRIKGPLQSK